MMAKRANIRTMETDAYTTTEDQTTQVSVSRIRTGYAVLKIVSSSNNNGIPR
jgi:hypothetical protein